MSAPRRSGVPEVDALLRKAKKQGAVVTKGKKHWRVLGPTGLGPVTVASSKAKATTVRNIKSDLRNIGIQI